MTTTISGSTGVTEPANNFINGAAPATPSSGQVTLYSGNDKRLYMKDDAGNVMMASSAAIARQTVGYGVKNSSGYANMLSAGSGLALNLAATATPMVVSFASGIFDYVSIASADVASVVSSLAANNLSYIKADYVSTTSMTWDKTLAPVQYGYSYNQAAQALLHFDGTAGATTMLDDYGNTWTAGGTAKLQTNQVKLGTAGLGGGGTANAMNGTSDYIKTTSITSLGNGSWALRGWVYNTAFSANINILVEAVNGSGLGATLATASTGKTYLALSSNGSTKDIANNTAGTATLALNTWYFLEVTFDAVAGKYFVYVNGTVDQTITNSAKVCAITSVTIGSQFQQAAGQFMQGYIDEFEFLPYCDHPNGTTYSVPVAASSVATTNYSSDFFSIPDMTMYKVTAASASAGANPTLTPVNRVYVGEAVTGAASVSSVVNYALNGRYDSGWTNTLPGTATFINKASNLGVVPYSATIEIKCLTAEQGFSVGDVATPYCASGSGIWIPITISKTTNSVQFTTGSTVAIAVENKTTGNSAAATAANWAYKVTTQRGW